MKKNKKQSNKEDNSTTTVENKNGIDNKVKEEVSTPAIKDSDVVIDVNKVQKEFFVGRNIIHVLKDINVQIRKKEFIVILGPSGSGKSTLLNVMLGLEPPTRGSVKIRNVEVTNKKPNQIAKIRYRYFGIVFQRAEWVRSISVLENVALPLAINGVNKKERIEKAWQRLKQVGMDTHASYIPTELSGGQQQKVTLARALINDADIVIADEPTGNLDSKSAERVLALLKDLNENKNKTLIMVTHNIDYVRYASRTIYIRDGQVIEGSQQFLS